MGTAFQPSCRSAKKGASPLPILFLALISINDNIPARTTWRANPVSVEAWLSGLKRQLIGKVFERTFAGSNPAASVESSAIHSLVFRFRLRKADGMVIPVLPAGMSRFDSVSRHSASGQRCARIISNKKHACISSALAGLFILGKVVTT